MKTFILIIMIFAISIGIWMFALSAHKFNPKEAADSSTNNSEKIAQDLEKDEGYLPMLQSNQQAIAEKLTAKGFQAEWGNNWHNYYDDYYKLVITENQIMYIFDSEGAYEIKFDRPDPNDSYDTPFWISIQEIADNGRLEKVEIGCGSGVSAIVGVYQTDKLEKPIGALYFSTKKEVDNFIKKHMSVSDIEQLIRRCEELQEMIKNIENG